MQPHLREGWERMREGEEGETCRALAWEGTKYAEENYKKVEIPSKTKEVVEPSGKAEDFNERDSKGAWKEKWRRWWTPGCKRTLMKTEMARISEETLISATDVILAITVAHPTWTEDWDWRGRNTPSGNCQMFWWDCSSIPRVWRKYRCRWNKRCWRNKSWRPKVRRRRKKKLENWKIRARYKRKDSYAALLWSCKLW